MENGSKNTINKQEFFEMLNTLTKEELVDYVGNYWLELKRQAEIQMKSDSYMIPEFARIKMTQVNFMRNLLSLKVEGKGKK